MKSHFLPVGDFAYERNQPSHAWSPDIDKDMLYELFTQLCEEVRATLLLPLYYGNLVTLTHSLRFFFFCSQWQAAEVIGKDPMLVELDGSPAYVLG